MNIQALIALTLIVPPTLVCSTPFAPDLSIPKYLTEAKNNLTEAANEHPELVLGVGALVLGCVYYYNTSSAPKPKSVLPITPK